jgi:hypothetical protein
VEQVRDEQLCCMRLATGCSITCVVQKCAARKLSAVQLEWSL